MPPDLQGLIQEMRDCTLCKGLELGPRPIFQLDENVRVLIVGQAPGRLTHAKNRPFDDPSGVRLREWLGVNMATFYNDERVGMFPMGLCFPGSGEGGDKPPRLECAHTWRARVMARLVQVELTLLLGRYAIAWHLPDLKNERVSDAVRHCAQADAGVFVLPHPSPRNNRWLRQNPWFETQIVPRIQSKIALLLQT